MKYVYLITSCNQVHGSKSMIANDKESAIEAIARLLNVDDTVHVDKIEVWDVDRV